jgi:hypothetical protein
MGSKAGKTTTGWRRRYLVELFVVQKLISVRLMRGRMKKQPNGDMHVLVADQKDGKWYWDNIISWQQAHSWMSVQVFDGGSPDEMLAMVAGRRLQGWTTRNGVPTW